MAEKSKTKTTLIVIIVLAVFCIFLIWFIRRGKAPSGRPEKQSAAVEHREENIVTLEPDAQRRGDIVTAPVEAMMYAEKIRAYGTVLQLQNLTELRNNYVQAKAQAAKAVVSLESSKKEYERLKTLNEDNKNVSDKALQTARAGFRNDEENVHASEESVNMLEETAHQQWGSVIAGWLKSDAPSFHRLIRQEDVLIQLSLPADSKIIRMPESVSITLGDGSSVSARFISISPRTDPHIQGLSSFYAAPSGNGKLLAGTNVTAELPAGAKVKGVFIPASSIVWWRGKSWVYFKRDAEHFERREVSAENQIKNGYFLAEHIRPGEQIVIKGAQVLLSREQLPSKPSGGEEEEED